MAAANGNGNGKKRVTFTLESPSASTVYVCGTFNNWDTARHPLKPDGKGGWKAQVMLPPGVYEYRLLVDGEWIDDPAAETSVPNDFGTTNCVREVATAV